MGKNFWWIFDAVSVLSIVICIVCCYRKGFSKIIVNAVCCVISIAVAWVISKASAGIIYDNFFKENNIKAVQTAIEDYHPEDIIKSIIEENELSGVLNNDTIRSILTSKNSLNNLYDYANSEASNLIDTPDNFRNEIISRFSEIFASQVGVSLPPYVVEEITSHMGKNEELFLSTIDMLINSPDKVPAFIEEKYIREPAKNIINASVFLIVFFVLITIFLLLSGKAVEFGLLNGFDRLDKFTGAVFGLIEAVTVIMIIAMLVKIIINISENENSFVSIQTVENTKIFKYFYEFIK